MTELKKGDRIHCQGLNVEIANISYQDNSFKAFDCEFTDTNGIYRSWKQIYDGGFVTRNGKELKCE